MNCIDQAHKFSNLSNNKMNCIDQARKLPNLPKNKALLSVYEGMIALGFEDVTTPRQKQNGTLMLKDINSGEKEICYAMYKSGYVRRIFNSYRSERDMYQLNPVKINRFEMHVGTPHSYTGTEVERILIQDPLDQMLLMFNRAHRYQMRSK